MSSGVINPQAAEPLTYHGRPLGRISVRMYEAMIASGVFGDDERFELIEGALVAKMTKGWRHSAGSEKCRRAIERVLRAGWHVRMEKPVRISARDSMPEPDVSVVRGDIDDDGEPDPGPGDVSQVVEVPDSTLAADRALAAIYVGGGIPTYRLLNVRDRQLEVYTAGAEAPAVLGESDAAELVLDGQPVARIPVADMLPRA